MKAKDQVCTNEDRSLWNHFMKQVHHLENRKKIKFSEALLILMTKLNISAAKCESESKFFLIFTSAESTSFW